MNSSPDKKRINVEDNRLSRLQDELIHKILSFIGIKEAIQTSVLSSRWRFIWTSMPYLDFSRDDFSTLPKLSEFITHVLSDRNNQTYVSSVKLSFHGKDSDVFVEQIMKYAFSHGIQQLNVASLPENDVELPLCLNSSRSLKHLSLTKESVSFSYVIKATSTWELPALTTLYLHNFTLCCDENTDKCVGFFYKCANLKNLTLKSCYTKGFKGLSICLPLLANLTLERVYGSVKVFNIVAPKLKNLTVRSLSLPEHQYLISAPDLTFLLYKAYSLQLSTNDFPSLEKADISLRLPSDAHRIVRLLQQLHNVKFLTLNLEIVEFLSSYMELISHQPSPFANLKSLKLHPEREVSMMRGHESVKMFAEVKSYLLDSSPGVTFTMVSREDIKAMKDTKFAQELMTELQVLLEQEKASTETKMAKLHELQKTQVDKDINRCWKYLSLQTEKGKEKTFDIIIKLKDIKIFLGKLPASNRAIIQSYFSTLCGEADIVMNKITDFMKMNYDEYQRRLSVCVHELATTLEPSS